jgi:hypothetical protein
MSRHSKVPIIAKLGISEGMRILLVNPPASFHSRLGPLPPGARIYQRPRGSFDFILLFVKSRASLSRRFARLARKIGPDGILCVAWPKPTSKTPTDLSHELVQQMGLEAGLVDTKACTIDETWWALRFSVKLKNRPGWTRESRHR